MTSKRPSPGGSWRDVAIRVRTTKKQACKKWTLTPFQKKQVCKKWTLTMWRNGRLNNSLMPRRNSLLIEIFSLLIWVGNFAGSGCGTTASCFGIRPMSLKIAKFPVKFPDSREFAWRPVRSTLRRQPTSLAPGENVPDISRKACQWRAFPTQLAVSRLPF
jgi:hypothetical protein